MNENELPQLPRAIMRKEDEPGHEKELWQPTWNCFCCHDFGIVQSHLAAMVIKGFDSNRDKIPRCQNRGCSAGERYDTSILSSCIDYRFSPEICQKLDAAERETWRETLQMQRQNLKKLNELKEQEQKLAQKMKMPGTRSRTPAEQMEAVRRSEEVKAQLDRGLNHASRQEMLVRTGEDYDL